MAGAYRSIADGLVLVITIIFCDYALDWLGFRFPVLQRLVHAPPLPLIKNGHLLRHNLRCELITVEELKSELRQQGVEDIASVEAAYMEGDGRLSVVSKEGRRSREKRQRVPG